MIETPLLGLTCSGVLALGGGLVFAGCSRTEPVPTPRRSDGRRAAMATGIAGVRLLCLTCVLVGVVFATIDVAMVAFAAATISAASLGCFSLSLPRAAVPQGFSTVAVAGRALCITVS